MGGGFSIQKFPPIITRDPLPSRGAFVGGISKGGRTQECGNCSNPRDKRTCRPCRLVIAQGVSASGAKLYREYGSISVAECNKFAEDSAKVNANEMAFDEFKAKLLDGKYYARQENGYCSQLMMTAEDLGTAKSPNEIDWNKARRPRIRRMTVGGGYSSSTKLYIKPAIPFRFKFNNETVEVSVMTLFHPSPIRVENVQHDAMLTLGDPADSSGGTVLLIPLAADNRPGTSGTFFSRVVSYMPGILQPNPATGQYEAIDAPTGKDWNLSMLFPGTPNEGETVVASPYYAWFSVPELEEYLKQQTPVPSPWPDRFHYSWREKPGTKRRFVMLAEPIPINTFDMQTIRMLPATPADEALPFIFEDSVVYSAALPVRQADGTVSACRKAPTPTSSIATPPSQRERFENKACDPFAQITPQERLSPSSLMTIIGSVIGAIAIFVGVYLALKYATDNNWGPKLMQWGRAAGKAIAGGPGPGASAPPKSPPAGPRDTERKEGETFAKENTTAIEARKAAAEKKKREAEIARTKADAEAEAKAKAEAEAKAKAEAEADAEEERKSAERRAARAARTPLQKAREKRRFANDMIIQRTGDITIAEGELANLETYLRNAETDTAKATQQKAVEAKKQELETLNADLAQAKRELKEADDEIAQLNKEIAPPKRRVIAMELTDQQEAQLETLDGKVKALESQDLSTVSPAKKQSVEAQLRALRKGIAEMRASPDRFADIAKALQTEIAAIRTSEAEAQDKALATMRNELAQIKARNARIKDQQAEAQKKLDQILARQKEAAGTGLMTPEEIRERDAKMERDLKALEDQVKESKSAAAGQAAAANVLLEQGKRFQDAYAQAQAKREVAVAETEKEDSETLARNLREANALLRRSQGTYARATQGRNLYTGRGKRTRRTHQR